MGPQPHCLSSSSLVHCLFSWSYSITLQVFINQVNGCLCLHHTNITSWWERPRRRPNAKSSLHNMQYETSSRTFITAAFGQKKKQTPGGSRRCRCLDVTTPTLCPPNTFVLEKWRTNGGTPQLCGQKLHNVPKVGV